MDWLRDIVNRLLSVFPRIWICAPHEGGVILTFGSRVSVKYAGWYIYWPLIQRIIFMEIKPQVVDLRIQSVRAKCGNSVAVSGAIQYRVIDPKRAILDVQDADRTLSTLALGIILEYVSKRSLDDCMSIDNLRAEILKGIRDAASGWGLKIERVYITDLDKARNIRLLTNGRTLGEEE
jgi:regulator of protease activity HflC (stomatin/prohibitin superfamily)